MKKTKAISMIGDSYNIIDISETRKFTSIVSEKDGKKFYIKLYDASDEGVYDYQELPKRIKKERFLSSKINKNLLIQGIQFFKIINVSEYSFYDEYSWVVYDFAEGEPVANWSPRIDVGSYQKSLSMIIDILKWFNAQSPNEYMQPSKPIEEWFKDAFERWSRAPFKKGYVNEKEVDEAKDIIFSSLCFQENALQHVDFVPWHMFKIKNTITLIDIEMISTDRPKFYDLAYLYHRTFDKLKNEQLAKELLKEYMQKVDDYEKFRTQFFSIFVLRCLVGIIDHIQEGGGPDNSDEAINRRLILYRKALKCDLSLLI